MKALGCLWLVTDPRPLGRSIRESSHYIGWTASRKPPHSHLLLLLLLQFHHPIAFLYPRPPSPLFEGSSSPNAKMLLNYNRVFISSPFCILRLRSLFCFASFIFMHFLFCFCHRCHRCCCCCCCCCSDAPCLLNTLHHMAMRVQIELRFNTTSGKITKTKMETEPLFSFDLLLWLSIYLSTYFVLCAHIFHLLSFPFSSQIYLELAVWVPSHFSAVFRDLKSSVRISSIRIWNFGSANWKPLGSFHLECMQKEKEKPPDQKKAIWLWISKKLFGWSRMTIQLILNETENINNRFQWMNPMVDLIRMHSTNKRPSHI